MSVRRFAAVWRPVYFFDGRVSHMDLFQTFGSRNGVHRFYQSFQGDILFGVLIYIMMTRRYGVVPDIHIPTATSFICITIAGILIESIVAADVAAMLCDVPWSRWAGGW
jgi:hypothetical protein